LPTLFAGVSRPCRVGPFSLGVGTALGMIACMGTLLGRGLLCWIGPAYVTVMRGIPEMVVMFWIYYCGPLILDTRLSSFAAAATSMSLYAGAFLAEIFRAGILAVPRGQMEAARALGVPEPFLWAE